MVPQIAAAWMLALVAHHGPHVTSQIFAACAI
jgi:hypothetical protein